MLGGFSAGSFSTNAFSTNAFLFEETEEDDGDYILVPHPEQKAVRRKKRVKTEQQRRNEAILFILMQ